MTDDRAARARARMWAQKDRPTRALALIMAFERAGYEVVPISLIRKVMAEGMTIDEIRTRLEDEGYSDVCGYMPGGPIK